jgi:uncharacterized protein YegJ (DUF2314 family)
MQKSRTAINKWIARSKTRSERLAFSWQRCARKNGDTVLEIKKGFIDGDKVEHFWIKRVTYDGKNFHGEIDNRPNEVSNVHLGEHVTVAPRDVTDWMFLKDGKLVGGYTTRLLYARLSPEDKAEFDKHAEFKIE